MLDQPTEGGRTAVVVFSGGQDSTTCLFWALSQDFTSIHAVTFDYGQRHLIEVTAAAEVLEYARTLYPEISITHETITLPAGVLQGSSPLVSGSTLEQYADYKALPGGLEKTFVPMRNQLFLTIAANRAFVIGAGALITGVCEEDFGGYPDCRAVFIEALGHACDLGTFTAEAGFPDGLKIYTPLMHLSKAQTVRLAGALPGAYAAMALTHTAYDGQYPPKGKDHATLLREKGFAEADLPDPLIVRAFADGLMDEEDLPDAPAYNDLDKLMKLAQKLPARNTRRP